MQVAHRIEIKVNNQERTYFKKACGVRRFCWNWGLARWNESYQAGQKPSGMALKKEFNAIKKEEFPWVFEVTKYAAQQPFLDLQDAWNDFFKQQAERPKFKKKGKSRDSFYIGGDQIKVEGKKLWIPNLGWVRLREKLRFEGKINSVVISRTADRWFAAIQVEASISFPACDNQASVGVDFGIHRLATLSNGLAFLAPQPLKQLLWRLKRKQRQFAKKLKGSKSAWKLQMAIARLHRRIASIRLDCLHKISTWLTTHFGLIGIEDLNVKGMMANRRLSKAISDLGFYELKRQLTYKTEWRKGALKIHDRFYPSSKLCSQCQKKKENLTLSDRWFECPHCQFQMDRDLNASRNLDPLLVPGVLREFTPEEMTALLKQVYPVLATSIVEAGNQLQASC